MIGTDAPPEPDRIAGAVHPRETPVLHGQAAAEAAFLDAFVGGRLHHAWLITGPRGIGKATLAWRIARFLLTQPTEGGGHFDDSPATLDADPAHPVARRLAAGADGGLFLLRRGGAGSTEAERDRNFREGRFSAEIRVDEVRRLSGFFGLSATDGGRRVVIVAAADEMTIQAANAFLKMLEEPPAGATLLLVSHRPGALLPTIRSRCRVLPCQPLGARDLAGALAAQRIDADDAAGLAELSGGSVGSAVALATQDGAARYARLVALLSDAPRLDRPAAIRLAEESAGRGAEPVFEQTVALIDMLLARLARSGVGAPPASEAAPGEAAVLSRLSPDAGAARGWAEAQQRLGQRARAGRAVNLDPATLVLDMLLALDTTAASVLRPR